MYEAYLHEISLPPELIIEGFIPGDPDCNYENYILEFLNASDWFMEKTGYIPFFHPVSEHFGECDCIAGDYGLDLKLVLSNSELKRKSHEQSRYYDRDGAPDADAGDAAPQTSNSPQTSAAPQNLATRLHAALRFFDLQALKHLDTFGFPAVEYNPDEVTEAESSRNLNRLVQRDVKYFLNNLETEKNLLLFHGYEMFFTTEEPVSLETAVKELEAALTWDFQHAMAYRDEKVGMETYMATMYDGYFAVFQWKGLEAGFRCIETIPETESPVYMKLRAAAERR